MGERWYSECEEEIDTQGQKLGGYDMLAVYHIVYDLNQLDMSNNNSEHENRCYSHAKGSITKSFFLTFFC